MTTQHKGRYNGYHGEILKSEPNLILGYIEHTVVLTDGTQIVASEIGLQKSYFEMANFQTKDSGLPQNIWFDELGKNRKIGYNTPRVKIGKAEIPFSISENPEILVPILESKNQNESLKGISEIQRFISDNHEFMLQHWNKEITTYELFSILIASASRFTYLQKNIDNSSKLM